MAFAASPQPATADFRASLFYYDPLPLTVYDATAAPDNDQTNAFCCFHIVTQTNTHTHAFLYVVTPAPAHGLLCFVRPTDRLLINLIHTIKRLAHTHSHFGKLLQRRKICVFSFSNLRVFLHFPQNKNKARLSERHTRANFDPPKTDISHAEIQYLCLSGFCSKALQTAQDKKKILRPNSGLPGLLRPFPENSLTGTEASGERHSQLGPGDARFHL